MKSFLYISIIFTCCLCFSCKKNINKLHGSWNYIDEALPFGGERKKIVFNCDNTFLLNIYTTTDIIGDTCKTDEYNEYVKGTYDVKGSYLYLDGNFATDSTYKTIKNGGCYRNGNYSNKIKIKFDGDKLEFTEEGTNRAYSYTKWYLKTSMLNCK